MYPTLKKESAIGSHKETFENRISLCVKTYISKVSIRMLRPFKNNDFFSKLTFSLLANLMWLNQNLVNQLVTFVFGLRKLGIVVINLQES